MARSLFRIIILLGMNVCFLNAMEQLQKSGSSLGDPELGQNGGRAPTELKEKQQAAAQALIDFAQQPVTRATKLDSSQAKSKNKRKRPAPGSIHNCPRAATNGCMYQGTCLGTRRHGCPRITARSICPNADGPNGELRGNGNGCKDPVKNSQWKRHIETCNKLKTRTEREYFRGTRNLIQLSKLRARKKREEEKKHRKQLRRENRQQ